MKYGWIAATLLMGAGLCRAQSAPPSLGDIARQNQAAHGEKQARKVITNDDLDGGTSGNPGGTSAGAASNAPAAGRDSSGPDAAGDSNSGSQTKDQTKDQTKADSKNSAPAPRKEVERLKKELESLKAQEEGWKGSASKYEEKLAAEPSEFRRAMYQDALANDRQNISTCQRKIEETESKLTSAEEAASRSGDPADRPGAGDKPHL